MRSRLNEILESGIAPGYNGNVKDPTGVDRAIPMALKELERTNSASKIAKDAGFSVKTLKETWGL